MQKYFILMVVPILMSFVHPIHVSVCDIEFDKDNNALEIAQRIFLDDLEKAVRNYEGDQTIDILNPASATTDDLVKKYLKEHFSISVNGQVETYVYLGHEVEGGALYAYMEIEKVKKLNEIQVRSEILTTEYDDQVNLVHVKVDSEVRSLKLTTESPTDKLAYKK